MRRRKFAVPDRQEIAVGGVEFDSEILDAIEEAATVLCKRWKPALLYLLGSGRQRYNALARRLPSATPKMLTQQLRELERDGLVFRMERSGGPRHVEYSLAPMGEALRPVIEELADWAGQYHGPTAASEGPKAPNVERENPRDAIRSADRGHTSTPSGGTLRTQSSTISSQGWPDRDQESRNYPARRLPDNEHDV